MSSLSLTLLNSKLDVVQHFLSHKLSSTQVGSLAPFLSWNWQKKTEEDQVPSFERRNQAIVFYLQNLLFQSDTIQHDITFYTRTKK